MRIIKLRIWGKEQKKEPITGIINSDETITIDGNLAIHLDDKGILSIFLTKHIRTIARF